jgi:hypothetical protein
MTIKRLVFMVWIATALQMASQVKGQGMPDSVRKTLGRCVGQWDAENRMADQVDRAELVIAWSPNQTAIVWHWKGKMLPAEQPAMSSGILGWDGEKKCVFERGFASTGEVFSASHEISPDRWVSPTEGTSLIDGKFQQGASKRVFKLNSTDEWMITETNRVFDGKKQPDIVSTFRRMKPESPAAGPAAQDYFNFIKRVEGDWTVKGKTGEKSQESTFSARVPAGSRCVVSSIGAILQYPALEAIEGYDPAAKKWKWSAIANTGEQLVCYSTADAASLKGDRATFNFETTMAKPDGKTDTFRGEMAITILNDQWTQVYTNQMLNGEKLPDEKYVYSRKTAPGTASGATAKEVLAQAQGKWTKNLADQGRTYRMEKHIQGNKETVSIYDGDKLQVRWNVDFEITKTGRVSIFTYRNMQNTVGPFAGTAGAGPGSYLFQIRGNKWIEAHNLMDGDSDAPSMAVYERVEPVQTTTERQTPPSAGEKAEAATLRPEDLSWLIGDWEGEYILPEGVPEVGPAGSKVVSTNSWRSTLDKKFIALKIHEEIDGKVASTGEEILGKDQSTGELTHWFFGSTGSHGSGKWRRNGNTWELKWYGFAPGGKKYEAVAEQVQIDPDSYTWQLRNITENGRIVPDWPKVTYRRKTAAAGSGRGEAATSTAKDLQEYGNAMVGRWEAEIVLAEDLPPVGKKGEKFKSTADIAWMFDKKGLDIRYTYAGVPYQGYIVWDPASRRIIETGCDSQGTIWQNQIAKEDGLWVVRFNGTTPDGKKIIQKDTLRVEDGGNTHIHVSLNDAGDGRQWEQRDVWKRVKK